MYEKDYIMKMLEAFSGMIARIVGLKEKGELDKAEALVMEAYDTMLKIEPDSLNQYKEKDWEKICSERSTEELEMVAELLRLEGEIRIESGNTEGVCHKLIRSLELFRLVESQSDTFSLSRFNKISLLEEKLSGADY
jgi:hypothetical protein